jgi:phospholipase C
MLSQAASGLGPDSDEFAVWFELQNRAEHDVTFTISATHYRSDGPWTYQLRAGETRTDFFYAVADTQGWYDFTVIVDSDSTWSRRFVGHIETGTASVSG